ncbi:hyaluronidase-3 [Gopherus evgoodei]|uniref:hyaluronidase-3 n=1 Tax=Gopherus evgoodei TaxID=1825980 RepID=UPI0011CF021B|nr:hyaluronidase-3 [Gopherus evgoodei]
MLGRGVHSGRKQEGVWTGRSCRTSTMTLGLTVWPWVLFCLGAILPSSSRGRSWESASASPLLQHEPFVVVWNMPTARCHQRFGVALPLEDYAIVENQGNAFQGQNMTIFYKNKFGLYPYISPEGKYYNGGIPQKVRLKQHLERATAEITQLLQPDFHGLAVVDWEEWRPLWRRNWGPKAVYKEASEQWVWERFPDMRAKKRVYLAEVEFEGAAQELMERTLELGKELRPWGLWGFYKFPDCFNDNWMKGGNYSGECNAMEVLRNNRLMWLWEASTALYPSIYLPPKLPPAKRQSYVHHRLQEAFRVARFGLEQPLSVIAYSRVSYRHSTRYLSEADLVHTIGESAALGATGLALWGDNSYSRSAESCRSLRHYITHTLGPYVVNVTSAAQLCSRQLCHGHGRCVRQRPDELGAFLHLSLQQWGADPVLTNYVGMDEPGQRAWGQFCCRCYRGWTGASCEKPGWTEPIRSPDCIARAHHPDICVAVRDRNTAGSQICPKSAYEGKTELR